MRILVGQVDDDPERDLVVLLVVEEGPHAGAECPAERPSDIVQDAARDMAFRVDVP